MKEATGELNMTVIVVIAIAAVAAIFYAFVWPMIKLKIVDNTCKAMGANYSVTETSASGCTAAETDDAGGAQYFCCPSTTSASS